MLFLRMLRRATASVIVSALLFGCASGPDTPLTSETTATLKTPRYGHAAVTAGKNIYLFGGSNKTGFLSSIEIIDPTTKQTTLLKDKLIPRRYLTAVWDGEASIYLFGGISKRDGRYPMERTVELFNIRTHAVTTTTQMPFPRRFNTGVRVKNKIYLAGGAVYVPKHNGQGLTLRSTPLFTVFDLDTQRWARLTDLPTAMSTRLFTYGGEVCFVGGYDGSQQWSSFQCYTPDTGVWRALPDTPAPVSAHSVVTHDNTLYVFGDYDNLEQVLMFNFAENDWSYVDLPYLASRHNASAVVGGEVFVTGGNTGTFGPFLDYMQVFSLPVE